MAKSGLVNYLEDKLNGQDIFKDRGNAKTYAMLTPDALSAAAVGVALLAIYKVLTSNNGEPYSYSDETRL